MYPKTHLIWGFIASVLLFLIFPSIGWLGFILIWASSVLIDIDHYLYFVYKTNNWNLKKSLSWYSSNCKKFEAMSSNEKEKIYTGLCFLHGLELILILFIAFFILNFYIPSYSEIPLFIIIGFIIHQILDAIDLYRKEYRFDKVISFTYSVLNSRGKKLLQEI
jgi:hypothetical protein